MWKIEAYLNCHAVVNDDFATRFEIMGPVLTGDDSDAMHEYLTAIIVRDILNYTRPNATEYIIENFEQITSTCLADEFDCYITAYGADMSENGRQERMKLIKQLVGES